MDRWIGSNCGSLRRHVPKLQERQHSFSLVARARWAKSAAQLSQSGLNVSLIIGLEESAFLVSRAGFSTDSAPFSGFRHRLLCDNWFPEVYPLRRGERCIAL